MDGSVERLSLITELIDKNELLNLIHNYKAKGCYNANYIILSKSNTYI